LLLESTYSTAAVRGDTFTGNAVYSLGYSGGAIAAAGPMMLVINDMTVNVSNAARGYGGSIALLSGASANITSSHLVDSHAQGGGGWADTAALLRC
jgi:hypothetical protein